MKSLLRKYLEKNDPELLLHHGSENYIPLFLLGFLTEYEPVYTISGVKVAKEYKLGNTPYLRITYKTIFGTKGDFENTLIGYSKKLHYLGENGESVKVNKLPDYMFNTKLVNGLDGNPSGYSSKKSNQALINERKSATQKLSSENPAMYTVLYKILFHEIDTWEDTGDNTLLHSALDAIAIDTQHALYPILTNTVKDEDFDVLFYIKLVTK